MVQIALCVTSHAPSGGFAPLELALLMIGSRVEVCSVDQVFYLQTGRNFQFQRRSYNSDPQPFLGFRQLQFLRFPPQIVQFF